jgi:putative aminopeptidase FrvX
MKREFEMLMDLVRIPGISGFEDAVRDYIIARIPSEFSTRVDPMGNVIATIGSGGPKLLFMAHMDEIGFLTTGITPDGYIRFQKIGTIDDAILPGTAVVLHGSAGPQNGVIGVRPPHLGGASSMKAEQFVIDVGLDSAENVRSLGIDLLQQVTFFREPRMMGAHRLNCRSLDDRFGCYSLLQVANHIANTPLSGTIQLVWSVQEEVGLRGAAALSHTLSYDFAFPVDAYATSESRDVASRYVYAEPGAGPVLRLFDHGSIGSPQLARWLVDLAARANIALQRGATGGETDGVRLQEAGVHMVPLAVAMRNLHSLAEMADLRDVEAIVQLIQLIIANAAELSTLLEAGS